MISMNENLRQIGEKALLQKLRKYIGRGDGIVRAFSEDCAVIDTGSKVFQLYTTDVLVEGVHFRREYMPFFYAGRKALKVNISDVAAMGGCPSFYMVSLGAPPETPVSAIEGIYDGMRSVAKEMKMPLLGGNVSASSQLFIDLFVAGSVPRNQVIFRNGARNGDSIFVSGALGASAEGLQLLQDGFRLNENQLVAPEGRTDSRLVLDAIQNHFDPPNLVRLGRVLAASGMVSSMIDLSDGLGSDLPELCRESRAGAIIEVDKLPVSPSVLYWEQKRNRNPHLLALQGGEDYHLLFTVVATHREKFIARMQREKLPVYEIGKIVPKSHGISVIDRQENRLPLDTSYQHFR